MAPPTVTTTISILAAGHTIINTSIGTNKDPQKGDEGQDKGGDPPPPITIPRRPSDDCFGGTFAPNHGTQVFYQERESYGPNPGDLRATGAYACYPAGTGWNMQKGTDTGPDTPVPPGLIPSIPGGLGAPAVIIDNASHLIAGSLGGSGTDPRNLVPLYKETNKAMYRFMEKPVQDEIVSGAEVFYEVIPLYQGNNPRPYAIEAFMVTNTGSARSCIFKNAQADVHFCLGTP